MDLVGEGSLGVLLASWAARRDLWKSSVVACRAAVLDGENTVGLLLTMTKLEAVVDSSRRVAAAPQDELLRVMMLLMLTRDDCTYDCFQCHVVFEFCNMVDDR